MSDVTRTLQFAVAGDVLNRSTHTKLKQIFLHCVLWEINQMASSRCSPYCRISLNQVRLNESSLYLCCIRFVLSPMLLRFVGCCIYTNIMRFSSLISISSRMHIALYSTEYNAAFLSHWSSRQLYRSSSPDSQATWRLSDNIQGHAAFW